MAPHVQRSFVRGRPGPGVAVTRKEARKRDDSKIHLFRKEAMTVYLCSDEEGGEHTALMIDRDDLPDLEDLGFRPCHSADYYGDGSETWQGLMESFSAAMLLSEPAADAT